VGIDPLGLALHEADDVDAAALDPAPRLRPGGPGLDFDLDVTQHSPMT